VAQTQMGLGAINVVADGGSGVKPTSELAPAKRHLHAVREGRAA
jgi:hypothetical protein